MDACRAVHVGTKKLLDACDGTARGKVVLEVVDHSTRGSLFARHTTLAYRAPRPGVSLPAHDSCQRVSFAQGAFFREIGPLQRLVFL
jgi:hypothetical protein